MKEDYSVQNNVKYDFVIKLRYDVSPSIKINFNDKLLQKNILYYQNLNQPLNMISDWFAMGSNDIINVWGSMYFYIQTLYFQVMEEENIWCNELLLRNHLRNNLVPTESVDYGVTF